MILDDRDWELLQTVWDYLLIDDVMPSKADAIIVGGSGPMTDGALRAAELYRDGVSRRIVVSGYSHPRLSAGQTEADLLASVLIDQGVPQGSIILDRDASNTGQNIQYSAKLLRQSGMPVENVILVHKPFMTRRFLATAEAQWPQPQPKFFITSFSTTFKEYFDLYSKLHDGSNEIMIGLMLGDYQRIKDYVDLGFSVIQPRSVTADMAFDEFIDKNKLMDIDGSVVVGGVVVKGAINRL